MTLTNVESATATREQDQKHDLRRYWDAHPISTDSVPHAPGSRESFEAIYARWSATTDQMRLDFLRECLGKKVLEVGCGIGKDARFLTENGVDYQGLDYSLRTLQLARQHFDFCGLRKRFVNGDATSLPFPSDHFDLVMSIGVLHHIPGTDRACREVVRVVKPGGSVRIMFYNRASYHYALVLCVVRPLIWLMLKLPLLEYFLRLAPEKFRHMFAISKQHGFQRDRLLAISADTSFAGEDNFIPISGFYTEAEMRALFPEMEHFRFYRRDLKYFPVPFLRRWIEPRWGFFLTMTARKPLARATHAGMTP